MLGGCPDRMKYFARVWLERRGRWVQFDCLCSSLSIASLLVWFFLHAGLCPASPCSGVNNIHWISPMWGMSLFEVTWRISNHREGEDRLEVRRRRLQTVDHAQVWRLCINFRTASEFGLCVYILTFLSGDRTKAGEEGEVSTVGWGSGVCNMYCIFMALVHNINSILAIRKIFSPNVVEYRYPSSCMLVEKYILLTWLEVKLWQWTPG